MFNPKKLELNMKKNVNMISVLGFIAMLINSSISWAAPDVEQSLKDWTGSYVVGDCGSDYVDMKTGDTVTVSLQPSFVDKDSNQQIYRLEVVNDVSTRYAATYFVPATGLYTSSHRTKGDYGCERGSERNTFDGSKIVNISKGRFYYWCIVPSSLSVSRDEASYNQGVLTLTRSITKQGSYTCSLTKK